MKEIKAIVREESVERVTQALLQHGVARLWTCHVHALGSGVDPEHYRLSMDEGGSYMGKVKVELVCKADDVVELVALIRKHAGTGHLGDGVLYVSDVDRVVNLRTGDENAVALL